MIKNMNHFNNIIVLSDIQLQLCNIINYTLESKNIVLPNFTINYLNIQSYINQYEKYKLIKENMIDGTIFKLLI